MRRQRRVVGTRERRTNYRLASHYPRPHASGEFVGKGDAAAMGTTSDQGGKLPAAVELPDCSQASPIVIRRWLLPGPSPAGRRVSDFTFGN
jgi:hypothetical protein